MGSEYDPVFGPTEANVDDLEDVRTLFARASSPFTRSPWSWWTWAVVLPIVALATRPLLARYGPSAPVVAWCSGIILAGVVEMWVVRSGAGRGRTTLAVWVLRSQANLSFVGVVISAALIGFGRAGALPGVWLLILGHSFLLLGGLAFRPFRRAGWIYQLAGLGALLPGQDGLVWFAAATALGNLSIGLAVRALRTD
ncbi:MAG: hypothetical protein O7A04_09125 [Acidobacteria bacterium]|nr:hypothetical protein [Acidobacteriota bacterium]